MREYNNVNVEQKQTCIESHPFFVKFQAFLTEITIALEKCYKLLSFSKQTHLRTIWPLIQRSAYHNRSGIRTDKLETWPIVAVWYFVRRDPLLVAICSSLCGNSGHCRSIVQIDLDPFADAGW